ncbi:MAG: EAL domain-containing protein [Gammaproteobacteria bacterium SHHR-1]|uniref:EAL domain-containing response regulator n=1 Tax=Magnetovirga frankeli TaxID=947516 RepID=UPI001293DB78|nr:EAL domain-containing protein [gamma proteobacterium SS-5]
MPADADSTSGKDQGKTPDTSVDKGIDQAAEGQAQPLHLLLLDRDIAAPKQQTAALRQAGFHLHPRILTNPDRLEKALLRQQIDILICNEGSFDGNQVLQAVARLRPQLPVLLIGPEREAQRLGEVLALGARDLIPRDDLPLLCRVFRRELDSLNQQRRAEALRQQLDQTQAQFDQLIDHSTEAIAYLDQGRHLQVNRAYQDLFGFIDGAELIGLPLAALVTQRDRPTLELLLDRIAEHQASGEVELGLRSQEYRQFDGLLRFAPAQYENHPCTLISIRNLSRARLIEQRIQLLSDRDSETGLINRRRFVNQLDERIPELQRGKPGSLIYLSIHNMASIRVHAGERASSRLLSEIGAELTRMGKQAGLFARLGDHSFALFCQYQDKGASAHLADALSQQLHQRSYATPLPEGVRPRFSLGLAEGNGNTQSGEQFLEQAFHACEEARQRGTGTPVWYDSRRHGDDAGRGEQTDAEVVELIDDALACDRFRLFYQPLVSLNGDSREHYSVLVRMLSSDNQTLLPERFLDYAKDHDRMAAIDRWVIKHAIAELGRQRQQRHRVGLFIQLSAESIRDQDLLLWLCDCLQQYDAKGPWLSFQIADRDVRGNPSRSRELIKGLKRIGCRLAISQFGVLAKYESLLRHLPLDYIKLDASYLKQLASDGQRQRRLRDICQLAKANQAQVIAGEVEEEDCLKVLWEADVHYVQGYLLQEPVESISSDPIEQPMASIQ